MDFSEFEPRWTLSNIQTHTFLSSSFGLDRAALSMTAQKCVPYNLHMISGLPDLLN